MSYMIKDLPEEEKPREKAIMYGVESLSVSELLSILLRTGSKDFSVKDLSLKVLQQIGGIDGLRNLRLSNLESVHGMGKVKSITLLAAIELGKRVQTPLLPKMVQIKETCDVYDYYHSFFLEEVQEKFMVLFLDTKNHVLNHKVLFIGTANQSLVHPRDVFREAILHNAVKILCIHNHPTGDVFPSVEDKNITKRIQNGGELIGITLLDHVILGNGTYYSFLERGEL